MKIAAFYYGRIVYFLQMDEHRLTPSYPFSAIAEVTDSRGAEMRAQATDISARAFHFLSNGRLSVGTEVIIRIYALSDQFRASGIVIHSTRTDTGVMFDRVNAAFLPVFEKWLAAARSAAATVDSTR